MFKKAGLIMLVISLAAIWGMAGCTKNATKESIDTTNSDPITLQFYQIGLALTDADFIKLFVEPINEKFPHITLELVRQGQGTQPEDLLVAGGFPDILFSSASHILRLEELGVLADLSPFVEQNNVNLNRFEADLVDAIKQSSRSGQLFALPFSRNFSPLFYNKDIFDKFGVEYPRDGMTWDAVYELARQVTRSADGIDYRGFDYGQAPGTIGSAMSLNLVDPKTGNADVNTEGWKKAFEVMQRMYSIPGNMPDSSSFLSLARNRTEFTSGTLAMFIDKGNGLVPLLQDLSLDPNKKPLNWDMATSPNLPEFLGIEGGLGIQLFEISSKSKHQFEAFKVIDYLTSKEVALLASKGGKVTALNDEEVQNQFGAELSTLQGKHFDAIFKSKNAKQQYPSENNDIVSAELNAAFRRVNLENQDINTALRIAQEAANKAIQAKK